MKLFLNFPPIKGLFIMNLALTLGFGVAETFFAVFMRSLGARGASLGVAIALYAAAKILFGPVMGSLADRIGKRTTLTASLILLSTTSLLYLFVTELYLIIVIRILQGLGFAMYRPIVVALVGNMASHKDRGTILGTFDSSFYLGIGLAPLLGGIVKDLFGFGGIFQLLFLLCLVALTACIFSLNSYKETANRKGHHDHVGDLTASADRFIQCKNNHVFSALLFYIFGRSCGIIIFVSFLPMLLLSELHITGTEIGIIMASTTLITALILKPMGQIADIFSRKTLIIIGGTAVSLLYCLIPHASTFFEIYLIGAGIGIFSGVAQPASSALLFEQSVQLGSGFALGVFNTSLNLGFVAGSLSGAYLQNAVGIDAVFYGAGLAGLIAVTTFFTLTRTRVSASPEIYCHK